MALQTKVGSFAKIDTVASQAVTGVGFTPKAIIFWTTGSNAAAGTWVGNVYSTLGYTAGPANSYAIGAVSLDAQTSSDTARRIAAKCITIPNNLGNATYIEADLTSFDADGFTLNWTTNVGGGLAGSQIMYMALGGSDITNAKVQLWTSATGTGNQAVTGVGFKPDLAIHALNGLISPVSGTFTRFITGAMNKHGQQYGQSLSMSDGANPSDTSRYQQTDACILAQDNSGATVQGQAHYVSMDSDGFTLNWSTALGAVSVISLCLKGVSSKIGSFPKTTAAAPASQSVTRTVFQPRAVMFSMIDGGVATGPLATASWGLGATDTVNSRVAHFFDSDNTSPTRAKSVYVNDRAVIGSIGTGAVSIDASATATIVPDGFNLTWSPNDTGTADIAYIALGDAGVNTTPATVSTSTGIAASTAFSNQRKIDRNQDGTIWYAPNWSDNSARLYYSKDNGSTWTYSGQSIDGWNNGSLFIDIDDNLHAVWKQSGTLGGRTDGQTYYLRGTPDAGRTSWTWGTALNLGHSFSNYLDVVAHREGTGWKAHVVKSYVEGTVNICIYHQIDITSGGVVSLNAFGGTISTPDYASGGYANSNHLYPSIDFNHTGDGKTVAGGTPHIYAGWSAGKNGVGFGIRFRKATYSAGSWTWGTEVGIDNNYHVGTNQFFVNCMFDGTRVIFPGIITDATTNEWMILHERDAADTTTTTRYLTNPNSAPDGVINGSATYDNMGNVYLIGRGEGYTGLYLNLYKWTRLTATLTRNTIEPNGGYNTAPYVSAKRGSSGNRIEWVYTSGDQNPYAVKYDYLPTSAIGLFIKKVKTITDLYREKMKARGFNI